MGRVLFVAGMHRSGTSATAGLLAHLGCWPGPQRELLPPNAYNPNGYWEHTDVVALNDAALAPTGGWASPNATHPFPRILEPAIPRLLRSLHAMEPDRPLLIKDPRLCRFLPVWIWGALVAGLEPSVMAVRREPHHVVQSLCRREDWDPERGYTLLSVYNADLDEALDAHPEVPAANVLFSEVLDDWRWAMHTCLPTLLPGFTWDMAADEAAEAFLRGGRRSA